MNKKMVVRTLGHILLSEALMLLLPIVVSIIYAESDWIMFLLSALTCAAAGSALAWIFGRHASNSIHAREGFVIVALAWILVSAFGALPFVLTRAIPNYIDAFFETVSGFTTTGSTLLTDVESLSHGLMFWRSFTHWIGGMGVLVFVLTVVPMTGGGAVYIMRAEMPGPAPGKLVPRLKNTAKILYLLYLVLTVIEIIFLCAGGVPLFESIVHSFGTAGTGGFGIWNDSIAHYQSPYIQWVICVFMLLFGVNFNLYYLLLIRQFKDVFSNSELRVYILLVASAALVIALNISHMYESFSHAVRDATFQVASIITTTGYITANYDLWPEFSKTILVTLMYVGGCVGSTGGGLKIARLMLLRRIAARGLKRMTHPRAVGSVKLEGKTVSENVISGTCVYMILYAAIGMAAVILLSLDGFPFAVNFTAMTTCINNIGPGLDMIGATGNFAPFSAFSKLVLSFLMLAGRLEIFPLLILFSVKLPKFKGGKMNAENTGD